MRGGVRNDPMTILLRALPFLLLVGCAHPVGERAFVAERTPTAAALAGLGAAEGPLAQRVREANERNDQRRLEGDWRAAKPAVGPPP